MSSWLNSWLMAWGNAFGMISGDVLGRCSVSENAENSVTLADSTRITISEDAATVEIGDAKQT